MKNLAKSFVLNSLAALLALTCSNVYSQTTSLEQGKSIEKTIGGGEEHSYNLTIASGMCGIVEVNQKSINVAITVSAGGKKLRVVDLTGITFSRVD